MHLKPDFSHTVTLQSISYTAALAAIAFAAAAAFWPHSDEPSYTPPVQDTVVADVQTEQPTLSVDLN